MNETLKVDLGERSYDIIIGANLTEKLQQAIKLLITADRPIAVISDETVIKHQKDFFAKNFPDVPTLILPAGENTKSSQHLATTWDFLAEHRIDRSGCLFVVGGGVIGDLGGFAAASYLRGIDFYQIPTTLLAMVDSSVGGKTGINLTAGKNLVGAFYQPQGVFIDTDTLTTLSDREFAAGMAEIIKYGLLADEKLFARLKELKTLDANHPELPSIIKTCCAIKADVVRADEKEQAKSGGRALLNLGHTFGHAIEASAGYGEYLHGEAIAIGLVMAARLSEKLNLTTSSDTETIKNVIEGYNLPVTLKSPLSLTKLLEAMKRDKKVKHGHIRFVAMEKIGKAITIDKYAPDWIPDLWKQFGAE